ncbi:MAG: hypothetical protein RIQ79_667 [Verrucomicrobiota bacterium]
MNMLGETPNAAPETGARPRPQKTAAAEGSTLSGRLDLPTENLEEPFKVWDLG